MIDTSALAGLGVALATPFLPRGAGSEEPAVDYAAFAALARRAAAGGADYLVVLGSTGEAATVLPEERERLVAEARAAAPGLPLAVGAGSNSTAAARELAARAAAAGADALLVVTPYYNKPQPAGLEAHFRSVVAASGGLPTIAYNVPGRTGLNLLPADLARLWAIPELVAVKESSGSLAQIGEIARSLPRGKLLLAGDDALALPSIAVGASGLVSVAANLLPAEMKALVDAALGGRAAEARARHAALLPLMDALFAETNPVPLKAALAIQGLCSDAVRLPLVAANEATRARLRSALAGLVAARAAA